MVDSEIRTRGVDYIVCGAGTSGCVVAARLAADPHARVLLLEAEGSEETDVVSGAPGGLGLLCCRSG